MEKTGRCKCHHTWGRKLPVRGDRAGMANSVIWPYHESGQMGDGGDRRRDFAIRSQVAGLGMPESAILAPGPEGWAERRGHPRGAVDVARHSATMWAPRSPLPVSAPNPISNVASPTPAPAARPPARAENLLVNLVCNVAIPTLILTVFSSDRWLGPRWGLVIALLFPVSYGLYDFIVRRRWNFIAIIGFVSVLISGGFGLLKVDGFWFAVKDAAIPGLIGVLVLVSSRAKSPLVTELLYNPQVIDVERVDAELTARGAGDEFARLLRRSTRLVSLAFFLSAVLNFLLARYLIRSTPGTPAFNGELGKMHVWSLPVIVLPSTAMMMVVLWRLIGGITRLTGLTMDDIFRSEAGKPTAKG
jgi:hypothetical protein